MIAALSWSGGKDSTLALDRALKAGVDVRYLFNIYEGSSGRVRFHGVRRELIAAQASALGLELVQRATGPDDFEAAFLSTLDRLRTMGVDAVAFGNIHLADIRAWYERRTTERGFAHLEPLWGDDPERLLREFIERGHRAVIVSVDLARGDPEWPGRTLDEDMVEEILARPDVDPCGERGEFHSFVFDGPLFARPVDMRPGVRIEMEGHALIDLVPATAPDQSPESSST